MEFLGVGQHLLLRKGMYFTMDYDTHLKKYKREDEEEYTTIHQMTAPMVFYSWGMNNFLWY